MFLSPVQLFASSQLALLMGDKGKPGDCVQHDGGVSEIDHSHTCTLHIICCKLPTHGIPYTWNNFVMKGTNIHITSLCGVLEHSDDSHTHWELFYMCQNSIRDAQLVFTWATKCELSVVRWKKKNIRERLNLVCIHKFTKSLQIPNLGGLFVEVLYSISSYIYKPNSSSLRIVWTFYNAKSVNNIVCNVYLMYRYLS